MHLFSIFLALVVVRQKNILLKLMNIRRSLATFDSVGCGILLVCVPAGVAEALEALF